MGKSLCDRIIFELFQRAQAASKRLQTKPGLTSEINPYYISPIYFWNQLQLAVGSEEDVHIRREVIALYVYALRDSTAYQCQYISGSKGEGFLFDWSDLDVLLSTPFPKISMESFHPKCELIATRNGCKPGFCKLTRFGIKWYWSRIQFLLLRQTVAINVNFDQRNHGPCFSTNYPDGFDRCHAIVIHPDSSNVFLQTFETKFWNDVKMKIINQNIPVMHCVPKGPVNGDENGHQWLISFSVLEQKIVHSLNHVQFCCYGLMKIIIHVVIDLCAETEDTVSSYHLKTVLFHILEDIHPEFWIPQNIFYCLRICLTRLLLFVMRGCCPSYFTPENNLFSKPRMVEKRRSIQENILVVLRCENALINYLISLHVPLEMMRLNNEPRKLRTFYSLCLALIVVNGHQTTYRECMNSVLKIMVALQSEENQLRIAILKYIWLLVMRRVGVLLYDKFVLTGFESYLLSAEVAFMFGQHADIFGSLYLATLWYCEKRYQKCIKLISETVKNLPITPLIESVNFESLSKKCSKKSCDYTSLFENHFVKLAVNIHKSSHFYPKDIHELVENAKVFLITMYNKSYAYFLLFLCYYNMHETSECAWIFLELCQSYKEFPFFLIKDKLFQQNTKKLIDIAAMKFQNFC
ncbi:uncharacterized protein LOC128179091 [Crassostrea angulata]|uniref:uncharacterized protein LOC128179091 n=1 Tax=Magallana angulata TaxID=2784310 RepID=UPI0022B1955A|nr:uncharacterized protein LOC128179091 [Crassostrea angulata]